MNPQIFLNIAAQYRAAGYRFDLDDAVEIYLDAAKCGRGWVGFRGKCKRSKSVKKMSRAEKKAWVAEMKAANTKEDRLKLANEIRKERGLAEIGAEKIPPKVTAKKEEKPTKPKTEAKPDKPVPEKIPPKVEPAQPKNKQPPPKNEPKADLDSKDPIRSIDEFRVNVIAAIKENSEISSVKDVQARLAKRVNPTTFKKALAKMVKDGDVTQMGSILQVADKTPPKPKLKIRANKAKPKQIEGKAGNGTHSGAPKTAKALAKQTGQSIERAEEQVAALKAFSGDKDFAAIKDAQRNGETDTPRAKTAKAVEEYIDNSVPYQGSIFRGMSLGSEQEVAQLFSAGSEFTTDSITSFSSNAKMAAEFATYGAEDGKNHEVVIAVHQNSRGASIKSFSTESQEDEVVVKSKQRYKVKSVKTEKRQNGTFTVVEMEES